MIFSSILSIIYIIYIYLIDELFNFSGITTFTILIPIIFCMINPLINLFKIKKKVVDNKIYYIILDIVLLVNIIVLINNTYTMYLNKNLAYLHNFDNLIYTTPLFIIPFIISCFSKKKEIIGKDHKYIILIIITILSFISYGDRKLINLISTIAPSIVILKLNKAIVFKTELQKYYFILAIISLIGGNILVMLLYSILYLNLDYNSNNY